MCGINGIYKLNNPEHSRSLIGKMNDALSHRGPDDGGIYVNDHIALGQRRLSIIDLSSAGHQPMFSADGRYVIVYNGELYNFIEIRRELESKHNCVFKTQTDTEVIIQAFAQWRESAVDRFNGMFAFAIWDNERNELFIARDRLGIKPLYFAWINDTFVFSSEVRSLLASDLVERKINQAGLSDFFRYQTVHAPQTLVKNVSMLMPGHYVVVKEQVHEVNCYWDVKRNTNNASVGKSYTDVCKDVNELLTASVERRLIADVPFGAFLSGGIDSSAVVGLMSKVSSHPVRTFSVTFDEGEFSEAKYARLVAKKFNTKHEEIKLTVQDFLDKLPHALAAMDHPSGDGPNTYVVSEATKQAGITMALSGLGGDELFAGYAIFKRSLLLQKSKWLKNTPSALLALSGLLLKKARPSVASEKMATLLKNGHFDFIHTYPVSRQVLLDEQVNALLNGRIQENVVSKMMEVFKFDERHLLSQISAAEISTYMQNVLLRDTDQMSMAHALEVRVPFLDYKLVEYVLGVKDEYKFPHTPKKLLTDSLGDLLPPEIINRPKMGFSFPWALWMKGELRNFCEARMKSFAERGFVNRAAVLTMWQHFLAGDQRITWSRIWPIVVLENWMQQNKIDE